MTLFLGWLPLFLRWLPLFLRWLPLLLALGLAVAGLALLRSESLRAYQNGFDAAKAECANRGLKAALKTAESTVNQQATTFAQLSALADAAAQNQTRLESASHALSQEYTRYAKSRADAPCLDADGLRLLRAADANTALPAVPTAAAQPDGPVPAAAGEKTRLYHQCAAKAQALARWAQACSKSPGPPLIP